ncbi:MAG: hypothetical protein HYU36_03085 [Planctomycetes bacterium]|nr:hypothetical protein [Planctomycetota bacterium]
MSELLVSVRSVGEASKALEGGAGILDVKEPSRGSLGMADLETMEGVQEVAGPDRMVSAALGEMRDWEGRTPPVLPAGLSYVKVGLAGLAGRSGWARALETLRRRLDVPREAFIPAVYVDRARALAPAAEDVAEAAGDFGWAGVLLDTCIKDGRTLETWIAFTRLQRLCERCGTQGLSVALAGSLDALAIRRLMPLRPDVFAVRGAACAAGDRQGDIQAEAVRALAALVRGEASNGRSAASIQPAGDHPLR